MTMMAGATRTNTRSGDQAESARQTIADGDLFAAERIALKAKSAARHEHDFARMAALAQTLLDVRVRRKKIACAVKRLHVVGAPVADDAPVLAGCHLVQPPQVGADARRLRLAAFEQGVAVVVLCREPLTQTKLQPIVALSPGVTVRAKVMPPKHDDKPDLQWFLASIEALGTFAIDTLDATQSAVRRVDALLERLDAIPEHEGLHLALQQACLDAKAEDEKAKAARSARKAAAVARSAASAGAGRTKANADAEVDGDDDDAAISETAGATAQRGDRQDDDEDGDLKREDDLP